MTTKNKNPGRGSRTEILATISASSQDSRELWAKFHDAGLIEKLDVSRLEDLVMVLDLHANHQTGWIVGLEQLAG
ncbi:MAG: hypothetical protein PHU33_17455 [Bacteroidales bacterium]|nr:hypothetical protein [Bacteroidales bacterium]